MMKQGLKILLLSLMLAIPMSAAACGMGEKTPAGYENTDVYHAYQHWYQGEHSPIPFMLLDVRTPEEYAAGHIAGAKLIPVQELAERMAEVPRDRQVYVYCRSGRRSSRAAEMLAKAGFSRIENVAGGIIAWQAAGYPIERGQR